MQRIFPPSHTTLCLRKGELVALETHSELGVYGGGVRVGDEVLMNNMLHVLAHRISRQPRSLCLISRADNRKPTLVC